MTDSVERAADGQEAAGTPGLALPPAPMLWRGVALGVLAGGLALAGVQLVRASLATAPVALVLGAGAVLAAWAAAIHVTGGERFDDGGCD
jgi:hypothetical protein